MNTSFGGNEVGSMSYLDLTGSYPTGLLAALAIYNDPAELVNAQLRYTAAQADINSQQGAAYAETNLALERNGTVDANSLKSQLDAINYKNASNEVNYANQNLSDVANVEYANAHNVLKLCRDASYSAYLTHEASQIILDRVSTAVTVVALGNSWPGVNPVDITTLSTVSTTVAHFKQDARNATIQAEINASNYLNKTRSILQNAIVNSNSLAFNLTLIASLDTLVKSVLKNLADPLSYIAGKELLVTQYVPSVPLNNAINVATTAIAVLQLIINSISSKSNTIYLTSITSTVTSSTSLASSLDSVARVKDISMDLTTAVARITESTASTMRAYGEPISYPDVYPNTPYRVSFSTIQIANDATKTALQSDFSACNARLVSDSLIALTNKFLSPGYNFEDSLVTAAQNSMTVLRNAMAVINKVTSNTSSYTGVALTKRSSNTVNGELKSITEQEESSISASKDVIDLVSLLRNALDLSQTTTEINSMKKLLWAANAATGKAEELCERAKDNAFILSRTAHDLVTPQKIAIQTASANRAGALNNNYASRLDRASRNVPVDPPPAYSSYKADIRAKLFKPVRPTLDELVYKNRLHPLRLDSLRTILDTKVKVAQEVQQINDLSAFSFRQQ